jgi:hypothetical protein
MRLYAVVKIQFFIPEDRRGSSSFSFRTPGQVDIVRLIILKENSDMALTTVYLSFSDEHGKLYSLSPLYTHVSKRVRAGKAIAWSIIQRGKVDNWPQIAVVWPECDPAFLISIKPRFLVDEMCLLTLFLSCLHGSFRIDILCRLVKGNVSIAATNHTLSFLNTRRLDSPSCNKRPPSNLLRSALLL